MRVANPFRRSTPSVVEVVEQVVEREQETEKRSLSTMMGGLGGYNLIDPLAIPPPGLSNRSWAGVSINEKTMLQADAVMTSLRIISNGIMELGNSLAYTEAQADDHWPYRKLLADQPTFLSNTFGMAPTGNIEEPQYIGIERTVVSMALWGEALWYVIERNRGGASAVDVLNPALFQIRNDHDGIKYLYGSGSDQTELNPNNLIMIPHKILPASMRGLSSLDFAGVNVAIALAAAEYSARWYSQGISAGWILSAPGKLGQDEVERIVQTMMIQHGGLSQAHLPMLMDSGIEPKPIGNKPDASTDLSTLEYSRSVIASYFGVPSSLLGNALVRQTPAPKGVIGEEMQRMLTWTLSGYINPLEQIYSALLPGKIKVAFDRLKILQTDAASFAALITALNNTNAMTSNEVRTRYLNLEPHPDGDVLVQPLASNTAPEQTDNPIGSPKSDQPTPSKEEPPKE